MSQTPPEETPPIENPSILVSTKAALGVAQDDTSFDAEILTFINAAFAELNQVGVGPAEGLMIFSDEEQWPALIGTDVRLNMAKPYVYLYCKMLFDPPEIGFVLTSMERILDRHIWRLMTVVDKPKVVLAEITTFEPLPEGTLGSPL
jgi:hypothetical protein